MPTPLTAVLAGALVYAPAEEADPRHYNGVEAVETTPEAEAAASQPQSGSTDKPAETTQPATPPVAEPPKKKRNLRIPKIKMGKKADLQLWVRYTLFTEWYRENYNTIPGDDDFVSLVNRLNLGADTRMKKVTLGTQLRLDGQVIWFPQGQDCGDTGTCVPVDNDVRLERVTLRADTRHVSAYGGDYNVGFGRGMGLSVRKIDEIGVDATIKGGRVDVRTKPVRASALAGLSNRQNSDFATRQLIPDAGYPAMSYLFSPDTEDRGCNVSNALDPDIGNPFWTICSDFLAGGRVEGTLPGKVDLGGHFTFIDFGDEITSGVIDEYLYQVGGDVGRTRIGGIWDTFIGAGGVLRNPNLKGTQVADQAYDGYAIYSANTFVKDSTTALVEVKHYTDYLVALNQNSLLQYTENPTLEREDQQVPGNLNATGGRIRVDHLIRSVGLTLYVNSLEYVYSENLGFSQFGDDQRLAAHNFAGVIWRKPKSDFVLQASGGYRHERYLRSNLDSPLKRRFPHGEFAITIPVGHSGHFTHSLTVRGEGRWENYRTQSVQRDFFRGLFIFGYSLSPRFSISYVQGVDTELPTPPGEPSLTSDRCVEAPGSTCRPHLWPGVQARVTLFNSSFIRVFAGRQVGGRVCVNGACRTVPDFEGVRSEIVFSF